MHSRRTLYTIAVALCAISSNALTLTDLQGTWTGNKHTRSYYLTDGHHCSGQDIVVPVTLYVSGTALFACTSSANITTALATSVNATSSNASSQNSTQTTPNTVSFYLHGGCEALNISSINGLYLYGQGASNAPACRLLSSVSDNGFSMTSRFGQDNDASGVQCPGLNSAQSSSCTIDAAGTGEFYETYAVTKIASDLSTAPSITSSPLITLLQGTWARTTSLSDVYTNGGLTCLPYAANSTTSVNVVGNVVMGVSENYVVSYNGLTFMQAPSFFGYVVENVNGSYVYFGADSHGVYASCSYFDTSSPSGVIVETRIVGSGSQTCPSLSQVQQGVYCDANTQVRQYTWQRPSTLVAPSATTSSNAEPKSNNAAGWLRATTSVVVLSSLAAILL